MAVLGDSDLKDVPQLLVPSVSRGGRLDPLDLTVIKREAVLILNQLRFHGRPGIASLHPGALHFALAC